MSERGERIRPAVKRASWTHTIETRGDFPLRAHVCVGLYPTGHVCEIFVNVAKSGSVLRTTFEAWAMTASRSLQHGVPLSQIIKSIKGVRDGSCAEVEMPDGERLAATSLWDAIAKLLESIE